MSGIDNRIVTMKFDNAQFEQNAKTSLGTLGKIKEALNFGNIASGAMKGLSSIGSNLAKLGQKTPFAPMIKATTTGFSTIGTVMDKLGVRNPFRAGTEGAAEMQRAAQTAAGPGGVGAIEGAVTGVSNKFLALTTVALTALSNITNRAVNFGVNFVKGFTFAPVMDGLREYETNLKSIQTIQANTDRPLTEINTSLDELNAYSDKTIYNFSEMARNIGTFTAAGVDLQTSVSSIKGIANLAALSGSNSQQAATAMYQLSQAIASGKVGLQDWNSVVNAGMGGKKFQNALAQTAIAMGDISKESVKLEGPMKKLTINGQSFRESIMAQPGQESWLSSDILVNTLSTLDGRFSEVALASEKTETGLQKYTKAQIEAKIQANRLAMEQKNGVKFTDKQFEALQQMSTMAFKSAQEVKTLGQVFDIAKETIGSGWSASFRNIFGNLTQAKKLFTGMSEGLTDIINKNSLARNIVLEEWSTGGGRNKVIDGLKKGWLSLVKIGSVVKDSFRDIFPAKTGQDLINLSQRFKEFMDRLKPSKETLEQIGKIASGVFSVFHILGQVLSGVAKGLVALFNASGAGQGKFLAFAGGIGEAVTKFDKFLEKSQIIPNIMAGIVAALQAPLGILKAVGSFIAGLFDGFKSDSADQATSSVKSFGDSLEKVETIGDRVRAFFTKIGDILGNAGEKIGEALSGLGDLIAGAITPETFSKSLDVINTGLLGGIVLMLRKFFSGGFGIDIGGGFLENASGMLEGVTDTLSTMQTNLKADILLKIAGAIGVLALSLLLLSTIDPSAMRTALSAMAAGFAMLIGAMAALIKVMGPAGLAQIWVVSGALTKLSFAMLLLAVATKVMASMELGDMLRGLMGMSLALKILAKALVPLAANAKGMILASAALVILAVGMNVLAAALKVMSTMSWEEMAKGLLTLTGSLMGIALALKLMPKGILLQSVALVALAGAMVVLATALKIFATMSWQEMGKGMATLAASLLVLAAGMKLMPKGILLQAAALLVVANALIVLSGALKIFATFNPEQMLNSLAMLGGALMVLAGGLFLMKSAGMLGAVSLILVAGALTILVPTLLALSAIGWEGLLMSLAALAGTFIILGVSGYLLASLTPVILGLGVALLMIGAGLALAGAGAFAFASAFALVAAAGSAGAQVMVQMLKGVISTIPAALAAFGQGIVGFAVAIGNGAPRIVQALSNILTQILNMVINNAPKFANAMIALVNAGVRVIVTSAPKIANAGIQLILSFLRAVASKVDQIVTVVSTIIQRFITALGREVPKIVDAGAKAIIKFIHGMADAIRNNAEALGHAAADLGRAIVSGLKDAVLAAAGDLVASVKDVVSDAIDAAKDFLGIGGPSKTAAKEVGRHIPTGIISGLQHTAPELERAAGDLGSDTVTSLRKSLSGLGDMLALDPNMNPTITPVLDLTKLTQEASRMSGILGVSPIQAAVSYQAAADIAEQNRSNDSSSDNPSEPAGGDVNITYEQHLHAPEPPDSITMYRDGKSLIALAKEELK